MAIRELVQQIIQKHKAEGIRAYPPATFTDITVFENRTGIQLPEDFKDFYFTSNGFECEEDIFNMIPLPDMATHTDNFGPDWFYFSEYMTYSDMWGVRIKSADKYEIFPADNPSVILSCSLYEFLGRFLKGNVFDRGGLYDWHEAFGIK